MASGGGEVGRAVAIVPARLASTRLPEKMLLAETGKPLVQHVVERAVLADSVREVAVAADDESIAVALEPFGTRVVMTSPDHANGTSRLAEAAGALGLGPDDVVVNVQGDEPEIEPSVIDAAVQALSADDGAAMATVGSPFTEGEDPANPNIVKVVRGVTGRALYFSRSIIPFDRDGGGGSIPLKHVGLYAYRRRFLEVYCALGPTPLERTERLEQLRVLEHGHAIAVAVADAANHGIDTREQYEAFVARVNAGL